MFLVYKPEGQPEQRWHFLPGRLKTAEMIAIEKRTGLKYGQQFKQELMMGGTLARQALLWTMLRREHHTLRFEDVDFYDDELQLLQDKDELAAEIEALETEQIEGMSDLERAAGLALLRRQQAEAPEAPGKAPTAVTPAEPAPPVEDIQPQNWPLMPQAGLLPVMAAPAVASMHPDDPAR